MSPTTTTTTTTTHALKTPVRTSSAPPPIEGVLNQAIIAGDFVFCSGQVGRAPPQHSPPPSPPSPPSPNNNNNTSKSSGGGGGAGGGGGKIVDGDVAARTHQCIQNLAAVLDAAGSSLAHVVKVNVFLARMEDFAAMNDVYRQYWGEVKPCRTCVAVKTLPGNTDVEIECVAVLGKPRSSKL